MPDNEPELRSIVLQLALQIKDLSMTVYAMHTFLQQKVGITIEQIEDRKAELTALYDKAASERAEGRKKEEQSEALRRMLESYRGPKQ